MANLPNFPALVDLYNYYNYIDIPDDKKLKTTIPTVSTIQDKTELSLEEFVSTFRNDKELLKLPLPERIYEKFNLPKPEPPTLNAYLFNSIKSCMSAGYQSELRVPKDNVIRIMPFISTITYYDVSGNECKFQSTINGTSL